MPQSELRLEYTRDVASKTDRCWSTGDRRKVVFAAGTVAVEWMFSLWTGQLRWGMRNGLHESENGGPMAKATWPCSRLLGQVALKRRYQKVISPRFESN